MEKISLEELIALRDAVEAAQDAVNECKRKGEVGIGAARRELDRCMEAYARPCFDFPVKMNAVLNALRTKTKEGQIYNLCSMLRTEKM